MFRLSSIKTQLILFLGIFLIYLSIEDRDAIFLLTTFIAVICAIGADSLFLYLRNKKFTVTESSLISGLIIGYVLSSDNAWWIFILASLFAVLSKHLIRINKKHIFNPAALGIFLSILLLGANTQWKGAYVWYILAPVGIYFVLKIRKIEVLISYALTSLSLFGAQALIQRTSLLNILGYLNYFFIFVMLIEPKTTPVKPLGKMIFGIGTAVLIFIFNEIGIRSDAEISSLLIFNLAVPLLNKFPEEIRREV